jgi:predicted permease
MNNFIFSLNAVLPVFLLIISGIFLKRIKILDDQFISKSSRLVFKVALPVLIFRTVSKADFASIYDGKIVLMVFLLVTVGFLLIFFISGFFISDGASRGAFVQGAFRSNMAIVGLGIIANVFGESGVAKAALPMLFIFPMYNIYSVFAITIPLKDSGKSSAAQILAMIIKNPLIIAVLVSLPFSIFTIPIPGVVDNFLSYIERMTLPLALLGVGGSLNFHSFKKGWVLAVSSSFLKLAVYPLVTVLALLAVGIKGEFLGVLFILMGCPTAVSSYVMADAMGSDRDLAAGIIVITTLGSILTIGTGIFILKSLGLI